MNNKDKQLSMVEKWDILDKHIDDYVDKTGLSVSQVYDKMRSIIRRCNVNMYEAMDMMMQDNP